MTPPFAEMSGGKKALAAAHDAAQLRLRRGAEALKGALPPGEVLFSGLMRKDGREDELVQFLWPGVLRELNAATGELIAETVAAKMIPLRPEAAEFLVDQANDRPLLAVKFQPPQSLPQRATIDAFGVTRVRDLKTGGELARSIPGDPLTLCPDFKVLKPGDFEPRYT